MFPRQNRDTTGISGTDTTGRVVKMRVPGSISRATAVNSPSPTASCFRSAQVLGRCNPLCIRQFNQGRFQFELRPYLPRVNKASFQKVSRLRMTSSKMELPPSRGRRSPPELFTHYLTLAPLLCYCGEMGATPPSLGQSVRVVGSRERITGASLEQQYRVGGVPFTASVRSQAISMGGVGWGWMKST